ncbi:XRE family transcriptional regulator [Micromonospora sp. WMMA1998]|uniref:helix-turn-helix domain-containing protein n=1 Tax=Micromonospora sp. WMMA1998 TaxID=3015167 RepID=UPI00248B83D8|nr:XRE family transcriptional regulator [Micromonospora sp. WMMA1998]WBC14212.1 XRE family transcriptional regulator [Micromonospora sp. WMMA1998]
MTSTNCPRCGGRLARDNDSGRCAPCQAAERDRLSAPPVVPESFWEHEPVRQALASRHLGRVIRAYRYHPYHGRNPLPQSVVAGWLGITQAQLSRVENGPALVHLDRLAHWAALLKIPPARLWFALPGEPTPTVFSGARVEEGGSTNRRQFHALAALAGIQAGGGLDLLTAGAEPPPNLGMEQVRYAASLVDQLRSADAAVGADALCDITMQIHRRLSTWAEHAGYSRSVGEALQSALAHLAIQAAWLAIDADRRPEARPYLNEAIARARVADDARVEVRALACMSLLLREDRPGEALHCAEAASRAAAGWATPRLTTLLHLRSAHAYAVLRDTFGFEREMTRARRAFDGGSHEDDLPFISFVTEQEVTAITGLSYLALDRPDRAAACFRAITASAPDAYRRNRVYSTAQLARASIRQGDVAGAARAATAVLPALRQVRSGRTIRVLAEVRSGLNAHRAVPEARQFFDMCDESRA